NGLGWGKPIDYTGLAAAPWLGLPKFTAPSFHANAIFLIAPVAIILVAENLGHIKAIAAMTGRNLDAYLGRAFLGDSIATIVSAAGGGTGVTTYAENIGVMAATRVYSTVLFIIAAVAAMLLGLCPKFGALVSSIPGPVMGGLSIVLFGLIATMAGRIWVQNRVDFANPRNLLTVAVALIAGAGDLTLKFGEFTMGGIGTATFGAIILYQVLAWDRLKEWWARPPTRTTTGRAPEMSAELRVQTKVSPDSYERRGLRYSLAALPPASKVACASFAVMATVVSISD